MISETQPFLPLAAGDTIGICALSGAFEPDIFEQGIKILERMGFRVHVPRDIYARKRYLAGDDRHRADIFNALTAMTEVKAIMCARGGFGAMGVLPLLEFDFLQRHAKPFVGFSDVSAALVSLGKHAGFPVIHGPVLTSLAQADPLTCDSLYRALTTAFHDLPDIKASNGVTLTPGVARGMLYGGNLATLCHLCGTPFQPVFSGNILFLEEINEPAYKIDRMLTQMHQAGVFQGITGVIIGDFQNCGDENILHELFHEHLGHVPLFCGVQAGHGCVNLSLPMGIPVVMDAKKHTLSWGVKDIP
ncbi:S66 peptidase family protein [Desulfocicer niacini]